MTHADQLRTNQPEQLRLQFQPIAHLVVMKAGHISRCLNIRAEVEDIHQHLHIPLALLVAAMLAGHE